ncbi:MAG: universal stress protein [Chloroflexi bacterium]|nr:universal stress protein [Chloroflexota bacterium]
MPRVLVPIDETEFAEHALPWAAALARATNETLHLLAVYDYDAESWRKAGVDASGGPAAVGDALTSYLEQVAARPLFHGLQVTAEVRLGNAAEQIGDASLEGDTSYIVIASHGEGGLKRFTRGSVADAVARHSTVPVLIVREGAVEPSFARLLVTLDGSETGESALAPARALAAAAGGEVHLLRVVNPVTEAAWTGVGPAPDIARITQQISDSALAYLQARAMPGEKTDVLYGRPLDAILQYANEHSCDVIVMASHGRGGIVRLAIGSTTDAVMRASDRPVLVFPHQAQESP